MNTCQAVTLHGTPSMIWLFLHSHMYTCSHVRRTQLKGKLSEAFYWSVCCVIPLCWHKTLYIYLSIVMITSPLPCLCSTPVAPHLNASFMKKRYFQNKTLLTLTPQISPASIFPMEDDSLLLEVQKT